MEQYVQQLTANLNACESARQGTLAAFEAAKKDAAHWQSLYNQCDGLLKSHSRIDLQNPPPTPQHWYSFHTPKRRKSRVKIPLNELIKRIMKKDKVSKNEAIRRINNADRHLVSGRKSRVKRQKSRRRHRSRAKSRSKRQKSRRRHRSRAKSRSKRQKSRRRHRSRRR